MSVSQVYPGRISNSLASQQLLASLTSNQNALNKLQTQLGTGKKFLLPSEAPTAAVKTLALQNLDERRIGFQESIQTNQGYLATADQTLSSLSDVINRARALAQSAAGDQVTSQEREGLAIEAEGLLRSAIVSGNTRYNDRYLFGGMATQSPPFETTSQGAVRYAGSTQSLDGLASFRLLIGTGIDGAIGLQGATTPESADLDPALTISTPISALKNGASLSLGRIQVTLDDGVSHIEREVDLAGASTVDDLRSRIENAFAADPITVTVDVDPTSNSAIRLTPSSGTIAVADLQLGTTARQLGIASSPAASITGDDLDPAVTLFTSIASLNGGAGIGATAGTGLRLVLGDQVTVVNLDGAATVQDVLNRIRSATPDVIAQISDDGRGLNVLSRVSGVNFSIGENGGTNASALGLRTFTSSSRLSDLNLGQGIPANATYKLDVNRRDGTNLTVDLTGASSIQDVLDKINAVDPGVLVASLNTVGNGISVVDSSGAGPLTIASSPLGEALGLSGTENTGAAGVLAGRDVNPRQPAGVFNVLSQLATAIRGNDLSQLERLAGALDDAGAQMAVVRGDLGVKQRQLDQIDNLHSDQEVEIKSQLEGLVDVDYAEAITEFTARQNTLQAYLQMAVQSQQLSILNYL